MKTDGGERYLEIRNLKQFFPIKKGLFKKTIGYVQAVNDVSFSIKKGETLGLVGESGCGKTTVGRAILHLIRPTSGSVTFKGRDVGEMHRQNDAELRRLMQIIFQDPYGSLNPRMNVASIIGEAPLCHGLVGRGDIDDYVTDIMLKVGLRAESRAKYPHEFSGGQRQRIGIARALGMKPEFVVCDKPVSALDVSIQSQVLNLLADLKKEYGLTYLFISHDLSVVRHISDRIAVLYLGKVVEISPKEAFFERPLHPYSQALISAIPVPDPDATRHRVILEGDVPSPINPPSGCIFLTRCPRADERCRAEEPKLRDLDGGHETACFLYEKN